MKFREYVGEPDLKVKRKTVKTNLGTTDAEFLRTVLRENPDGSRLNINASQIESYFGYGLSKKNLKRVFDYIKSWFLRYEVPFEVPNPYLTTHLLANIPKERVFMKALKIKKVEYEPRGTLSVISNNEKIFPRKYDLEPIKGKDYIVLDYYVNKDHRDVCEKLFDAMNVDILGRFCFVKLFEVESGILNPDFFRDMMYSAPEIPKVRLGGVSLIRRRHYAN